MSCPNPVPSLARGVARRVVRESGLELEKLHKLKPTGSRQRWLNQRVDTLIEATGDWYVDLFTEPYKNPKKVVYWVVWIEAFKDNRDLGLYVAELDSRHCRLDINHFPVTFAQHAIERITQRLKSYDPKDIAAELKPAARQILINGRIPKDGSKLFIPTVNGVFLGERVDGEFLLKTFVSDEQLRPDQVMQKQTAFNQ